MEDHGPLGGIIAGVGVDAGGAGDHLLQPRTAANMGQGGDDSDFRGIQAFIGHGDGNQDAGFGIQTKAGENLMGIHLAGRGKPDRFGLAFWHPLPGQFKVAPSNGLVRGDDEELAEAARGGVGGKATFLPAGGAQFAGGLEGLAQQFVGKSGAQRGEQVPGVSFLLANG